MKLPLPVSVYACLLVFLVLSIQEGSARRTQESHTHAPDGEACTESHTTTSGPGPEPPATPATPATPEQPTTPANTPPTAPTMPVMDGATAPSGPTTPGGSQPTQPTTPSQPTQPDQTSPSAPSQPTQPTQTTPTTPNCLTPGMNCVAGGPECCGDECKFNGYMGKCP